MMSSKSMEKKEAFWAEEAKNGKIGTKASASAQECDPKEFTAGAKGEYPCQNVDMLSFVSLSDLGCSGQANDIWGWTDPNGNEYALSGCSSGTSFVDITDPLTPLVLGFLPSQTVSSSWRDIKVFNGHAYIGSEASSHGVQVLDLSQLTDASNRYRSSATPLAPQHNIHFKTMFTATAVYTQVGSSHNIVINEDSGIMYVVGARKDGSFTCRGGLHMVDINDPTNPQFVGCFSEDGYTHDAQCVIYSGPDSRYTGKEICFAYNEDTITIVDVTIKSEPVILSRTGYTGHQYTHQGWLNEEQSHLVMDDELDEMRTGVRGRGISCIIES